MGSHRKKGIIAWNYEEKRAGLVVFFETPVGFEIDVGAGLKNQQERASQHYCARGQQEADAVPILVERGFGKSEKPTHSQ